MKYAIITPTFKDHFKYIKLYLKSFERYVEDYKNCTLYFTINKDENNKLNKIITPYKSYNIQILFFEDILRKFNIKETPDELLKKYGKFSFQSLKKFYTMLYLGAEYHFLILDSESMWISKTNIQKLFSDFFHAPYISSTELNSHHPNLSPFTQGVINNVNFLLKTEINRWFLENFVWFYEYKILNDLFTSLGSPIELAEQIRVNAPHQAYDAGIFEIELYQAYLYLNYKKYNYKHYDLSKKIKNIPANIINPYLHQHQSNFHGNTGILEHTMMLLTKKNIIPFANLFKELNFNIIRCDKTDIKNYKLQKQFLNIVRPNILAASQDHLFGINETFTKKLKVCFQNKSFQKLQKHIHNFINPIKRFFKWLCEPFSIIFYLIKTPFIFFKGFWTLIIK